jgi:hypothetical protein
MCKLSGANWVPETCSLPTVEQPLRVAEFELLFRGSLRRVERVSPILGRIILNPRAEVAARDLAALETSCCSFFTFRFTPADEGLVMELAVPPGRAKVLDALLLSAEATRGV